MYALFLIAAGLVTAISEFKRHGKFVKAVENSAKSGLITATGVLAGVLAVYYTVINTNIINGSNFDITEMINAVTFAAGLAALTVFCFVKSRGYSVYYRLFFAGQLLLNVLLGPIRILWRISEDSSVWEYSFYVLGCAALLALVLVDAVRNRRRETKQT